MRYIILWRRNKLCQNRDHEMTQLENPAHDNEATPNDNTTRQDDAPPPNVDRSSRRQGSLSQSATLPDMVRQLRLWGNLIQTYLPKHFQ